ncbi:MAG: hypothetical protein H6719_18985 [Sandaracinaceae bacterium]|nr:hypothetical protein [Sandaracinaceae bacterium]
MPLLALASRTNEPVGFLDCPPELPVTAAGQVRWVALPGAAEGAPSSEGASLGAGARVALPLPPNRGWVEVRVRSAHADAYQIEAHRGGAWVEVGRIEAAGNPGIRNRPAVEVEVGNADELALRARGPAALAMACVRGPRWPIPLYIPIGFAIGLLFVLLRSIPLRLAERAVRLWGRYDAVTAVAYGAAVLHSPLLLISLAPAALLLRAWRRHRAPPDPEAPEPESATAEPADALDR